MELCGCEDEEKEKCTDCIEKWRHLCRKQRTCDFGSGDCEDDINERESVSLLSCLCWCNRCWCCLFPRALWTTLASCLYVMRSFCLACLVILLCGVCYLCASCSDASCSCCQPQSTSNSAADRKSAKAEDIVWCWWSLPDGRRHSLWTAHAWHTLPASLHAIYIVLLLYFICSCNWKLDSINLS